MCIGFSPSNAHSPSNVLTGISTGKPTNTNECSKTTTNVKLFQKPKREHQRTAKNSVLRIPPSALSAHRDVATRVATPTIYASSWRHHTDAKWPEKRAEDEYEYERTRRVVSCIWHPAAFIPTPPSLFNSFSTSETRITASDPHAFLLPRGASLEAMRRSTI